jgi:hypothetical protein
MRRLGPILCLVLAGCGERERLWHASRSPRVEGTWRMALLGENDQAPPCSAEVEELEIRIDEWFADPRYLEAAARDERGTVGWGGGLERTPAHGPWEGWTFEVLGRGSLSVDGRSVPASLVGTLRMPDGTPETMFAALLLDCAPGAGPLAGCGWGNRLELELYAAPGNADGSAGWGDDHVLVSYGETDSGGQWPHEYARVK